mgnify:CR=1 FL=1
MTLVKTKPEKSVREQTEKVWRVDTVNVDFQTISPEVTLYGRVETPRKAALKSALVADVVSVAKLEGDTAVKGQLLVELDNSDASLLLGQRHAELSEINATVEAENLSFSLDKSMLKQETKLLSFTQKTVDRAKKLEKTKLVSQASLDDALAAQQRQSVVLSKLKSSIAAHNARLAQIEARKKRTESLVQQAELDLQRTQITAPFDGRISELNVSVGDRLRVGDSVLSIYDTNDLEVRAQIPGRYIEQVSKMLSDNLKLEAVSQGSNTPLSLVLNRLSGQVKLDSGGIDGLFRFNKQQRSAILGQFVNLKLSLAPQKDVIAIPPNALYGLDQVYLIDDGYLKLVDIQRVGEFETAQGKKNVLIRSNSLQQGDVIISTQLPNATTGLRVEAISE